MEAPIVVLDACVLYPAALRDLFMRLAVAGLIQARWTDLIHEEWIQAVLRDRPDLERVDLDRTRRLMDEHAEGGLIRNFDHLIPSLHLPDPDDRHVLAAAMHGIWSQATSCDSRKTTISSSSFEKEPRGDTRHLRSGLDRLCLAQQIPVQRTQRNRIYRA